MGLIVAWYRPGLQSSGLDQLQLNFSTSEQRIEDDFQAMRVKSLTSRWMLSLKMLSVVGPICTSALF